MGYLQRLWRAAFFTELNPLIRLGATRGLQATDIPLLPAHLDPRRPPPAHERLDWSTGPQLLRSLLWQLRPFFVRPMGYYLANAAFMLSGPVLVNAFIKRLEAGVVDDADLVTALLLALGIGTSGILSGLCIQQYFYRSLQRQQILINLINARLFRHALVLSKDARERIPVGDIVNHLSTDTDSVSEVGNAVSDLVYCAVMVCGAVGLLFHYLGATAWVAVVLLAVLAPVTRKVSREFTRLDEELMKHRDRRVSLMSQILNAVRLVKYFVWEKSVERDVQAIRRDELGVRRRIARAELWVTLVYVSVGTFVLFAVLGTHAWRGGALEPALIFTCVGLFSLLEDPFAFISRSVSSLINAKVGGDRICAFLARPTVVARPVSHVESPVSFVMRAMSVRLGELGYPALNEINLEVAPGESLAIVGPVGGGKSTLLHALLGELPFSAGSLSIAPEGARIGYVPQEAYVLNGSLRENLSFGNDRSDEDLWRALDIVGLTYDVRGMPGGLATEIGERGINLSGGQKQRLSLARAVLHRPQLALLDDPLSAVDPATEAHLVEHLLFAEWTDVTRVVVTHRLGHLARFDRVAFVENGRLAGLGTLAQLRSECPAFARYLEEYERAHADTPAPAPNPVVAAPASPPPGENTRITEDEDREWGAVGHGVYLEYVRALGGAVAWRPLVWGLLMFAAASGTLFPLVQKVWLAAVADAQGGHPTWLPAWAEARAREPLAAIYVYGVLGLFVLLGNMGADLFWLNRGLAAGRSIHDRMFRSVLRTGVRFFDSTPAGRIVQRFARDMEAIDTQLQWAFEHAMKAFANVAVTLVVIVSMLPMVMLLIGPVLVVYYQYQKLYRASAREAKRLDSIARSPRYAHFKETLNGLVVIRAFGRTDWFLREFYERLAHGQRMFFGHYMVNRWFSSRIPMVGGLVALCTGVCIVWSVRIGSLTPATAGLLAVYSLNFWGMLNWGIRVWSDVEARMTSLERVKAYSTLPPEPDTLVVADVPAAWPSAGRVVFENVHARYAAHLAPVLKGLSFTIEPGAKVGIVGRTGAGKSTVFQALYRFLDVERGRITIDGVDIAGVPLARLRKSLAIIPQDPTLFMGTVRANLDRDGEYTDAALWAVLDRTAMGDAIRRLPHGLATELTENGANMSQGQRQLMCLARALLTGARVIILDEATASVDVETDAQVQRVVRDACAGVTMLIIAHRLGTVADCDQILAIREGRAYRHDQVALPIPGLT